MAEPAILVVDDNASARANWKLVLRGEPYALHESATAWSALEHLRENSADLVLTDVRMERSDDGFELLRAVKMRWPQVPVIVYTNWPDPADAVLATALGADDYLSGFDRPPSSSGTEDPWRTAVQNTLRARGARRDAAANMSADRLIDSSREMDRLLIQLAPARSRPFPILIVGETGTGKELLARWIHAGSGVRGPLIPLNCGALPASILESELFGHKKGTFTSADADRLGIVESANGGTLFLDEIGELPLESQAVLLRFLDSGEYRRLGDTSVRRANVRVIAATNRDLKQAAEAGRFRQDLYFRLAGVTVRIPPLRSRPDDLVSFVERWARRRKFRGEPPPTMTSDALEALLAHNWPGNFRELHAVLERAELLSTGERMETAAVRSALGEGSEDSAPVARSGNPTREEILAALDASRWKKGAAARALGIDRWKLRRLMHDHNIS